MRRRGAAPAADRRDRRSPLPSAAACWRWACGRRPASTPSSAPRRPATGPPPTISATSATTLSSSSSASRCPTWWRPRTWARSPSSRPAWPASTWWPTPPLQAFTPVKAGTHAAYGGPNSPCGHIMRSRVTQVVYGPGTFLNRAVAAVNTGIESQVSAASQATKAAEAKAYQLAIGEGMSKKKALQEATVGRAARVLVAARIAGADGGELGTQRGPVDRRPQLHPADRVRPDTRGQPAQGPLLLPVPHQGLGADPGPSALVAVRRPAGPGHHMDPPGGRGCRCSARPTTAPTRSPAYRW